MKKTIACIGSGNIGPALMKGISKVVDPEYIGFTDLHPSRARAAADSLGGQVYNSNSQAVEQVDFLFLAVKPQVYKSVLEEIKPAVRERLSNEKNGGKSLTLISVVAGWSIAKIRSCLDLKVPIARIMPNTPVLVSRGLIAMSTSPDFPAERIPEVETLLSGAGLVDHLDEVYMDSVTGLSGSGPAFVYIFIEALADGGVRAGLPRDKALRYAVQTVLGSAHMVQETGKHPGELKDMVTSPGGTTIAGIAALENGAFRGAVINAVEAAWRRSSELFSAAT
jgi:pyrroline-5-carboxylate reductase